MKSFFALSIVSHVALLGALIVLGTLLSKPRMSYYAVDLFSAPAGGGTEAGPAVSPASAPAPAAPKAIAIKAPKVKSAPSAPRAAEEELPDQDTIRMLAKLKKKRLGLIKSQPSATREESESQENASEGESAPQGSGHGSGIPGSGSGIMAEAGPAFPYPWYLTAIADKLDKQWHPPQDFQPDTLCQVTFVISRTGQISGSQISKSSGDSLFDQLALRAVLYANPLPPLPNGFPDETLKVHMKFMGRR